MSDDTLILHQPSRMHLCMGPKLRTLYRSLDWLHLLDCPTCCNDASLLSPLLASHLMTISSTANIYNATALTVLYQLIITIFVNNIIDSSG